MAYGTRRTAQGKYFDTVSLEQDREWINRYLGSKA
jgi:hypothetical protein